MQVDVYSGRKTGVGGCCSGVGGWCVQAGRGPVHWVHVSAGSTQRLHDCHVSAAELSVAARRRTLLPVHVSRRRRPRARWAYVSINHTAIVTPPSTRERSSVVIVSVCVLVCPRAYLRKFTSNLYQILCAYYLWPWLNPPLASSRYVIYFRFYGWRHTCT